MASINSEKIDFQVLDIKESQSPKVEETPTTPPPPYEAVSDGIQAYNINAMQLSATQPDFKNFPPPPAYSNSQLQTDNKNNPLVPGYSNSQPQTDYRNNPLAPGYSNSQPQIDYRNFQAQHQPQMVQVILPEPGPNRKTCSQYRVVLYTVIVILKIIIIYIIYRKTDISHRKP